MATSLHNTITNPPATLAGDTPAVSRRLESLDVFRGLTIAGMILVNNPGSDDSYWPLNHADELMSAHPSGWYSGEWWVDANGWTPTDLIFPFFLFIVGTSMVMSFAARHARGDSRLSLMKHAVRRSALILLIGYAIRILPSVNFSHMRYPGVLQRIAVVYLCASAITLWTSQRARIIWIAGLLAGYYAITRFVSVPGCDHSAWLTQMQTQHCTLAGYIDRKLMFGHLYRRDFDPEGLLSTISRDSNRVAGYAGRRIPARSSKPFTKSLGPRRCRSSGSGRGLRVASLVPHQQTVVDEFIRPLHRRGCVFDVGSLLVAD